MTIFRCFDVRSVRPPQLFQVQAKISTVRPLFSDYLSVSYDYVKINYQLLIPLELNINSHIGLRAPLQEMNLVVGFDDCSLSIIGDLEIR